MIKSMTGFGRGENSTAGKTFTVEVRTINHRYTDISIRMPRHFNSLEDKIREFLQTRISRGKIDVFVSYSTLGTENKQLVLDEQLAEEYVSSLLKIKDKFNLQDGVTLSLISRFPDIIKVESKEEDLDEIWNIMSGALEQALSNLVNMRQNEGERLKDDILKRLDIIRKLVEKIELRAPFVVEEYRQKLNTRIAELMKDAQVDETRLATEVAIMADRTSITEEIVRLYSHLKQMASTLDSKDAIGRKLDFIVQEMNRESNTIGSKANDIEVVNSVVEIKSEIEKIREQIQNIE